MSESSESGQSTPQADESTGITPTTVPPTTVTPTGAIPPQAGAEPPVPGADPAADAGPVRTIDVAEPDPAGQAGQHSSPPEPVAGPDAEPVRTIDGVGQPVSDVDQPAADTPPVPAHRAAFEQAADPASAVYFGYNLDRVPGKGEDSDPIVRTGVDDALVAVFDGMGGAGGTVYQTPDGPRTGAYLASRIARDVVERHMLDLLNSEAELDGPAAAAELRRSVGEALAARLADLQAPRSGLRSKLLRALPTTMALLALRRREPGGAIWTGHLLWAGDSRVYAIDPAAGAHQLTLDDIREGGDAMENLREDSVVSNAISADTAFVVHSRSIELTEPFVALAATDGCFGYLPSPMHFERLILSTLDRTPDVESWSSALQAEITATTGDDAAMALVGLGGNHERLRTLFAERLATLNERWTRPLDEGAAEISRLDEQLVSLRRRHTERVAEFWSAYKSDYGRFLDEAAPREDAP